MSISQRFRSSPLSFTLAHSLPRLRNSMGLERLNPTHRGRLLPRQRPRGPRQRRGRRQSQRRRQTRACGSCSRRWLPEQRLRRQSPCWRRQWSRRGLPRRRRGGPGRVGIFWWARRETGKKGRGGRVRKKEEKKGRRHDRRKRRTRKKRAPIELPPRLSQRKTPRPPLPTPPSGRTHTRMSSASEKDRKRAQREAKGKKSV